MNPPNGKSFLAIWGIRESEHPKNIQGKYIENITSVERNKALVSDSHYNEFDSLNLFF